MSKTDEKGRPINKLENVIERGRKHNQGTLEQLIAIMGTGE